MLQKMSHTNEKGFTLIELMIVIAIIGILAAIAIPNFVAYRNKSFCSAAESDANAIAAKIADYFSVPTRINRPTIAELNITASTLSNKNTADELAGDPNGTITITVNDTSQRCPADYQAGMSSTKSPKGYWNGSYKYIKTMEK